MNRKLYMGQIIAECDCSTPGLCDFQGQCLAVDPIPVPPKPARPSRDEVGLRGAEAYALLATCPRRKVGCLIVDVKGRPLSVGYNGVASGRPHCIDHACPGAGYPSGQGLEKCEAIHAEQNAILQLRNPDMAHTAYVTTFPCNSCIKLFLGTNIQRIVYRAGYPHGESQVWWAEVGREVLHIPG